MSESFSFNGRSLSKHQSLLEPSPNVYSVSVQGATSPPGHSHFPAISLKENTEWRRLWSCFTGQAEPSVQELDPGEEERGTEPRAEWALKPRILLREFQSYNLLLFTAETTLCVSNGVMALLKVLSSKLTSAEWEGRRLGAQKSTRSGKVNSWQEKLLFARKTGSGCQWVQSQHLRASLCLERLCQLIIVHNWKFPFSRMDQESEKKKPSIPENVHLCFILCFI